MIKLLYLIAILFRSLSNADNCSVPLQFPSASNYQQVTSASFTSLVEFIGLETPIILTTIYNNYAGIAPKQNKTTKKIKIGMYFTAAIEASDELRSDIGHDAHIYLQW